ncbi:MAG: helix-turn-helix domain-containing protein [Actinobacteria bacterium]|nr:helix-turn-helix domain-containing protein [Actinomycetota bacterium]
MANEGDPPAETTDGVAARSSANPPGLDILKALGDNTRYAIYLELARSPLPLSTAEVADALDLHVNTVRPHLERMRDVGLLQVDTEGRGGVGRPQHRYSIAVDAPSLGLEPSPFPTLAKMLLAAAAEAGLDRSEMLGAGREQGRADARGWVDGTDPLEALIIEQMKMGFDPEVAEDDRSATMAFAHCPFQELARIHPDLVCGLHCGLVEGLVTGLDRRPKAGEAAAGDGADQGAAAARRRCRVVRFHGLVDRDPCQVELAVG